MDIKRVSRRTAAALSAVCWYSTCLDAASWHIPQARADAESDWTVLTVSIDGGWGVSTARSQGEAIARALNACRLRAAEVNDCGAEFLVYKSGWSTAVLCGPYRVLESAETLEVLNAAVYRRTLSLRETYDPLGRCRHILTIDPVGTVSLEKLPISKH